jgi:hypothetical protein
LISVAAAAEELQEEEELEEEAVPILPLRGPPTLRPGAAQNPEVSKGVRQSEMPSSRRLASMFG